MQKLDVVQKKILSGQDLDRQLAYWRFKSQKIVFTNGCFDILHRGHIDYLSKAADLGHVLIVGLNTDDSVRRIKGPERPIKDEFSRALILSSLSFVSAVVLFDEDTPYNLIEQIQPDILVKGSDYNSEEIVGYDIVKAKGGKVITIDYIEGFSSTRIIERMRQLGEE